MSALAELDRLESVLGHSFARPELLVQALTHRSQAYELAMETTGKPDEGERTDNERLEFVGDAVLGLVVAEGLFQSNPASQEGELTRLRARLVSRSHMAEVAHAIGLGEYLRLGKGEERSGGRKKAAILANSMEAVIAALYLDGGLEPVRQFAQRHILGSAADDLARELRSGAPLGDHKSALQEHLQATHAGVPVYLVKHESGPDHRKRFQVELRLRGADGQLGEVVSAGAGTTKKKAEQEAASRALIQLAGPQSGRSRLMDQAAGPLESQIVKQSTFAAAQPLTGVANRRRSASHNSSNSEPGQLGSAGIGASK